MIKKLYPKYMYNTVLDIEADFFSRNNIKNVILDIDNTLVPYTQKSPDKTAKKFINRLKSEGINICLVSNNTEERVNLFNKDLRLVTRHRAAKPLTFRLKSAMKEIGALPEESAIIGDQIFTDVLCGNSMKMTTVLVEPIEGKENMFFKFKRSLEKKIINHMKSNSAGE